MADADSVNNRGQNYLIDYYPNEGPTVHWGRDFPTFNGHETITHTLSGGASKLGGNSKAMNSALSDEIQRLDKLDVSLFSCYWIYESKKLYIAIVKRSKKADVVLGDCTLITWGCWNRLRIIKTIQRYQKRNYDSCPVDSAIFFLYIASICFFIQMLRLSYTLWVYPKLMTLKM